MAKKPKLKENVVRPAPGGVREIFPGEPLHEESPPRRSIRKDVFEVTDEEKRKKRRESHP